MNTFESNAFNILTLSYAHNSFNATLISRLILHLRNPALNPEYQGTTQATEGIISTVIVTDGRDATGTQSTADLNLHSKSKWEHIPLTKSRFARWAVMDRRASMSP